MSFNCSYCGGNYCSNHRLPENHDCDSLDEAKDALKTNSKGESTNKNSSDKWFKDQNLKEETTAKTKRPRKPSLLNDISRSFKSSATLSIIIFTTLFFFIQISNPRVQDLLILQPAFEDVLQRPWTLLSVLLLHGGLFHLFANMVTFYFFGKPLENIIGNKELIKFYLFAGLLSSISLVLFQNLLLNLHGESAMLPAVGASGAVVAVVGAIARLYPKAEVLLYFFIPMKIRTAVYAFGVLEVVNLTTTLAGYPLPVISIFASSAHLTGLAIGLWYGEKLRDKHQRDTAVFDPLGY